ncbi:MAG: exodeoxyribonuclease V subunit beta [Geobacteraceae bacterium GWC2_55_20]|nr:MAG: exodeoxyribonuclease V subunit beta [Geobacteraceae bacterium GWC2_55_20]OGU26583.1 MAG: exodeoxyribonuclease V subunit beta [Geobacteraceae bacterium GWF2_54_21]HBA71806.1 exodeoxyribonuclease V subunit beta [Geobacter sp.]
MKPLDLKSIDISGSNLIEASAGTGKTWTIAALYILLLLEKELRPEQILVVTYTKAATAELRDRIRRRIGQTLEFYSGGRPASTDALEQILDTDRRQDPERARLLLTRALYSFDNAAIFTIHGFCQRALLENAFESGSLFDSEMITDQSAIVQQVCDDFWRSSILTEPDEFLEHLVAGKYTPEKLAAPFAGHYQNPGLKIVPERHERELNPLIAERDRLYVTFCESWKTGRDVILEQIESAGLHQGSYSPNQIATAAGIINSWVEGASAKQPCGKLEFFSSGRIASKVTKTTRHIPDHDFFTLCQQMHDLTEALEELFRDRLIACRLNLKRWLERELRLRKQALNKRCFDDLLLDLHLALEAGSGGELASRLRERYRAALIDEFQDTDPLQWNIFRRLGDADGYPLFLIGDPKQAIYSFRGADVFAYLKAGSNLVDDRRHTLGTNFRSTPALVTAVNRLFSNHPDPFLCTDISFEPVTSGRSANDSLLHYGSPVPQPLQAWIFPRDDQSKAENKPAAIEKIVQSVAGEIARLLEPGHSVISSGGQARALNPGDIAILVKSHKQAELVQQALQALCIPSVQQGSATIFKTTEALDLLRILRAVAEPGRERLLREALLTGTMGLTANQVAAFVDSSGEDPEWEAWLLRFHDLHAAAGGGVVAVISRLLGNCGVRARVLSRAGGERCLTNILHCCELLHQAEHERGTSLPDSINWLERRISGDYSDDATLLRLETDDNAVIISTIHTSKGLQYPLVFVPFAWDAPSARSGRVMFHDPAGNLVLDLAEEDENRKLAGEERDAEAARLLYVALTRAEFRCYFVWGCINGAIDSPLFNLLHHGKVKKENKSFAALEDLEILTQVRELAAAGDCGLSAELMPPETSGCIYRNDIAPPALPGCRTLSRPPRDDWRVASFSGMLSGTGHGFQPHDHDNLVTAAITEDTRLPEPATGGLTIFDFPRGAKAGTCLHEIFEQLDFCPLNRDDITRTAGIVLAANGFQECWLPAVSGMIADVASASIIRDDPGFCLSRLRSGSWQCEMEFYLPLGHLAPETIRALFDGLLEEDCYRGFHEILANLSFRRSRGMLQGFIDLVFEHAGRYYILDWKSNYLGHRPSDYGQEQMRESMARSAYILQYHLYTLALDRLLKRRLPDYDYETHFGGAIYVYLRGVTGNDAQSGIYRERPSARFVARANRLLLA